MIFLIRLILYNMRVQIANDFGAKRDFTPKYFVLSATLERLISTCIYVETVVISVGIRSYCPTRLFFAKGSKTIYVKGTVGTILKYGGSVAVGAVSGFFGGGGGMLCVPLLQYCGLDAKRAHATALLVILPLCIVSASIYIANGYFDGVAVLCACIGVVAGGAVGAAMLDKLNGTAVGVIFALLMIAIGIKSVIA